jgi:hypothetical protein
VNRVPVLLLILTVTICGTTTRLHAQSRQPLTAREKQVQPYLLEDVRHYDAWPSEWELFGLTEDEIKTRYGCDKGKNNPVKYKSDPTGDTISFDYGRNSSVFKLDFDEDGKVAAVQDLGGFQEHTKFTSRENALRAALDDARKSVKAQSEVKDNNPGLLWWAFRNRARIYKAMGREPDAQRDIKWAEWYEVQILRDPKKALKDNRMTAY